MVSTSSEELAHASVAARLRAAGCVFAEDEAALLLAAQVTPEERAALVDRRVAGEPLEHLLGWAEFAGQRIAVWPGVFVPRRRSELMVREAVAIAPDPAVVVDLCCGSGAIGAAVASSLPRVELHAADIDPAAVVCARRNLSPLDGRVYQGDLFDPLPEALRGRIDLLLVNAPYVPSSAVERMPPEARDHEPLVALDGGSDGLKVLRRVTAEAPDWLAPGAALLVETSARQAPDMAAAFAAASLVPRIVSDEGLSATVVVGSYAGT